MRSTIIVEELARMPGSYEITIIDSKGHVQQGLRAGSEPGVAAGLAAAYIAAHCMGGGDLIAPAKVRCLIPDHLRSIPDGGHQT